MTLLFASANQNKIREISSLMPANFTICGLADMGITEEIPEPGHTIKENSYLKAKYVLDHLSARGKTMSVFADDSGLEVRMLDNGPGVHSARYAGIKKDDAANNKKLLEALANENNRKARFVTVITFIHNNEVHYFEGEITGTIAHEVRGNSGFGYDPLFIPRGYRSTFGELGADVKNVISHRAEAVKKFISFLNNL